MKKYRAFAIFKGNSKTVEEVIALGDGLLLFNPEKDMSDYSIQKTSAIFLQEINMDSMVCLDDLKEDFQLIDSSGNVIGDSLTFASNVEDFLERLDPKYDRTIKDNENFN